MVLTFVDDQGGEGRPGFPECRIAGDFQNEAREFDFVEGTDGFHGAAGRRSSDEFPGERTEFEEEFLPAADDDFAAFDLAERDDAAELGCERLVVGDEKHALSVAVASVAECEFEGVPGLAGARAAVDEELAVFRELVQEGESGSELPFEELLGVIDEGALFLRQRSRAEGFQHGAFFQRVDGIADAVAEDPQPGGDPVIQVVAGDEPVSRDALEILDIGRRIHTRHA